MPTENDDTDSAGGDSEKRSARTERLDENKDHRAESVGTEVADLREKVSAAKAAHDAAEAKVKLLTNERNAARDEVRALAGMLAAETNARHLVANERDELAEKLFVAEVERDDARRDCLAAEEETASERSVKRFFMGTTVVGVASHLLRPRRR